MEMRRLLSKTLEFIKASMESDGSGTFGIILNKGKFEIFLPESIEELFSVYDWVGDRVSEVEGGVGIYVNFLNVRDMATDKAVGLLCWDGQKKETIIYPYKMEGGHLIFFSEEVFEGHLDEAIEKPGSGTIRQQ